MGRAIESRQGFLKKKNGEILFSEQKNTLARFEPTILCSGDVDDDHYTTQHHQGTYQRFLPSAGFWVSLLQAELPDFFASKYQNGGKIYQIAKKYNQWP
jgi:hypothetical protein